MSKEDILKKINHCNSDISNAEAALKELEKDYEATADFSTQCNASISSFDSSISLRKDRLSKLSGIAQNVKSAAKYSSKMNSMLTEQEYNNTTSQIEELRISITQKLYDIQEEIDSVKRNISTLYSKLSSLQYEYNHFPVEEVKS